MVSLKSILNDLEKVSKQSENKIVEKYIKLLKEFAKTKNKKLIKKFVFVLIKR